MPAAVRAPPENVRINSVLLVLGTAVILETAIGVPLGSVRVISAVVKVESAGLALNLMDSLNLMRKPVIDPASRPVALEVVTFAPVISGRVVPVPDSTTSKMVTVRVWLAVNPEESVARMVTI